MTALWIKICGLRDPAAIEAAVHAGVQAIGFVFHAASVRNITPSQAQALQPLVPAGIERIAVFLHPDQALVDEVLDRVRPDRLQTDADDLARLRLPQGQRTLPVFRTGSSLQGVTNLPARLLLESGHSGSGETADWQQAALLAARAQVVLAGGLDSDNVGAAIQIVRPFGVDVSSGVESSRGIKDPARIQAFVTAARAAHARLANRAVG